MTVVTISGQTGSGARDIGRLAAERLQIDYVDQEILVQAAQELGVSMESVVSRDERTATFGERLGSMFRRFLEQSAAASAADPMLGSGGLDVLLGRTYAEAATDVGLQEVSDKRYLETLTNIVNDIADHGNVLIIGRGSQVILRDRPDAVHILLVAPLEWRVEEYARRPDVGEEEAAKLVRDGDKGRQAFHHKFFKVEVDDPALYHLSLNAGRLPFEEIAQLIGEAAPRIAKSKIA